MRYVTTALSTGVALLAVGMFVTAAEAKPRTQNHPHTGTFVSATAGKLVMTGRAGKEHSHALAKDVKVTIDGKPGAVAGLKKGMTVSVTTDTSGAVTSIATVAAKPVTAAKPATPASTPAAPATTPVKPASTGK
jgi:hypothetical protein